MEIEEVQAELQALWKLYALHRQFGDSTGTPESTLPFLDERARTLLKDLLDRRWETALQTYSELLTTAQPNQPPPPPAPLPKRQCRYCQQRSFKRQASIVEVPESGRILAQPRQVFVRDARSVASTASNSSRIRRCRSRLEDSRRFSWTSRAVTSPSRSSSSYSISDSFSSKSSSYAYTESAARSVTTSESSISSYSIEKPAFRPVIRTPIARVGPARRRGRGEGDKFGVFKRLKNKLGLVFHHHDHHHHRHSGGMSMWRQVKEMLRQGRRRRSDDDVEKKGKRQSKLKKPPVASAKNKKKRLHWWQLNRRREAGRNKKPNKSRTTTKKR